jgi:hypothetical protein
MFAPFPAVMKTHPFLVALIFAASLTPCWRASGQYTGSLGGNFNNPGSALLQTMIANRMLADAAKNQTPAPEADIANKTSKPSSTARLTFKPVAKNLMVKELAESMSKDETARGQFATLFEEYLKAFDDQARKDGEPSYDVGRAAAFFVLSNYAVASGRELTDEQGDGAQAKFRAGLAGDEGFAKMSDRDRQRLYEALVILGSLPATGLADATEKKDEKQAGVFREFARMNIQTLLGVTIDKIQLTRNGFTIAQ